MTARPPLGVLGAGSWGTALAVHAARAGIQVRLWARDDELCAQLRAGANPRYLPGVELPSGIAPSTSLAELGDCNPVLLAVPSHAFRATLRDLLAETGRRRLTVISGTKGVEEESLARMSEVCFEEGLKARCDLDFAVLSGPSFAAELVTGTPTAVVIAAADPDIARAVQQELSTRVFRLYTSSDVVGVELGGATKNVIAIGAGIVAGLGFGHNTLAALVTRGLHEITRLGLAYGGRTRTFSGLAGMGDLVLTCTGGLSRNRRTGEELARGRALEEIGEELGMVAEGVRNSITIARLAARRGVEMPITEQMVAVMYDGKAPERALGELMTRDLKAESEL